jgi:hypothetical protein
VRNFNPYDIDPESIPLSRKITNEKELLKYRLSSEVNKVMRTMTTDEIVKKTGLNPADISRIKIQSIKRFTIDRLIKISFQLGLTVKITLSSKQKAS